MVLATKNQQMMEIANKNKRRDNIVYGALYMMLSFFIVMLALENLVMKKCWEFNSQ
jgi:hypothetical protein